MTPEYRQSLETKTGASHYSLEIGRLGTSTSLWKSSAEASERERESVCDRRKKKEKSSRRSRLSYNQVFRHGVFSLHRAAIGNAVLYFWVFISFEFFLGTIAIGKFVSAGASVPVKHLFRIFLTLPHLILLSKGKFSSSIHLKEAQPAWTESTICPVIHTLARSIVFFFLCEDANVLSVITTTWKAR